jgi:ribosomal protein S18 acetylase RimI-like enzyme
MTKNSAPACHFRRAVEGDLAAIVGLLADDILGRARNPLYEAARPTYDLAFSEMLRSGDNFVVVAESEGEIVGCYQLTFIRGLSHAGALRAQVESVRVASNLRGNGLGSQMMQDAIERARARHANIVQLTTDTQRPDTRRFYERHGFAASHHGMKLVL